MDSLRTALPFNCYRLFVMPLCCRDANGVDLSPVLYEKVETFLKNLQGCKYLKFLYRQEIICVVLNYQIKDEKRFLEALEVFLDQLGLISERILGTLGLCRMHLEELKQEFWESGFLEQEIFYDKGIHLYRKEKKASGKQKTEKFDFRKFTSAIAIGKYQEALELFSSYIYSAAQGQMQEFKLKNQTKNLLYNLIGSSEEHVQELEYIRKNYAEELNLQELAQEFNFSYSYLSAYFNQHVCEGFSEYLNRIRIQKSCEFLENSKLSIAEISSAVGYSDQSYFCRVFKKITGSTPSAFRRESR